MSKKLSQIQRFDQRGSLGSQEGMELSPPHLVHSTWAQAWDHLRIIQVRENFNYSLGDSLKRPRKSTFGWCYTADFFTVYVLVVELTLVKISDF